MATEKEHYTHKRCIICSTEETSKNICRDKESYDKLMKFFWEGLSVDMKPMEYKNHEFCHECCSKIVEFYDTNEVLVKLEKHMRTLQKTLIRSSVQNVQKLKSDGHPLLRVHKSLFESKLRIISFFQKNYEKIHHCATKGLGMHDLIFNFFL